MTDRVHPGDTVRLTIDNNGDKYTVEGVAKLPAGRPGACADNRDLTCGGVALVNYIVKHIEILKRAEPEWKSWPNNALVQWTVAVPGAAECTYIDRLTPRNKIRLDGAFVTDIKRLFAYDPETEVVVSRDKFFALDDAFIDGADETSVLDAAKALLVGSE